LVGVASISVILTNQMNASPAITAERAIGQAQAQGLTVPSWATEIAQRLGDALHALALDDMAASFSTAYWVAAGALVVTFVVAIAFLPRKHEESHLLDDQMGAGSAAMLH
jgi:hypothetical protein